MHNGGGMSIKSKLILIITIFFIVFYTATALIVVELVHERSEDYYEKWVVKKKSSLQEIIEKEFSLLSEGYYYLAIYNISPEILISSHDYTSIIYYSADGEIQKIVKNPRYGNNFSLNDAKMLSSVVKTDKKIKRGFWHIDKKLLMYISFPLEEERKYKGYVAIIKKIDEKYLESIRNVLTVDMVEFSADKREIEGFVSGFVPLKTSEGKTIGYLRIGYRNVIDPLIIQTYYFALVVMGAILLSTILLSTALVDRIFLRRISILSEFMKNIGRRGFRTGERIFMSGDDEIKDLADSINTALDEIERSKKEISGMAENLRIVNRILRHDILNDLTVIRGFAEIASEKQKCDFCPRIIDRAEKAVETIKKLRNVEEALSESELYSMKVSEVIENVLRMHDVQWEIDGDATVLADDGLFSVFDNLVTNAIKHGKTSRIRFEIEEENGIAVIRVIDYGKGIPDSIKERIFEEGFTLGEGSGLGLYIVKKLIEKYGGEIAVGDNRPSGTIFTIKLKIAKKNRVD